MKDRDYNYIPVKLPNKLRARVLKLAKKEKRGIGRQAETLIELGLAEYERQHTIQKEG